MEWKKEDEIFVSVKVDRLGVLGKIAKIDALEEELGREVHELKRMISAEEKGSAQDSTEP